MAKRKLTGLRTVLLQYMLLCGGGCALILLIWWGVFMQLISAGFLLPAVTSAQACAEARQTVAEMRTDTFDASAISDLCRYAVVVYPNTDQEAVLQSNMNVRQLKIALNALHGGSGNLGMTQYQYNVKMADGAFCLLQYDYAVPYADPALRGILPDFQTVYLILLVVLLIAWLWLQTHFTVKAFAAETARLAQAIAAIAAQKPADIRADKAKIKEFSSTLQALQTMGTELTDSLQSQWRMEQQRTEQLAALTHDLKTPLTIIRGNAELLAETPLSAAQTQQTGTILRAADRAEQYLTALRAVNAAPAAKASFSLTDWLAELAETGQGLCAPKGIHFSLQGHVQGTLTAARGDVTRAVENLLDNAARCTPAGGSITLTASQQGDLLALTVQDSGPGFTAEALARAGQFLYTDAARPDNGHQGLGLYFARITAQNHGGSLTFANTDRGAAVTLTLHLPAGENTSRNHL